MEIWKRITNLSKKANVYGIYLPMVSDPTTGKGSVSLTLVFLASIWVQIGFVGKVTGWLGGFDMQSALYWFMACAALYWGRKLGGSKENPSFDDSEAPVNDSKPLKGSPKPDSPDLP